MGLDFNSLVAPLITALLTGGGVYVGMVKQLTKLETKMDSLTKQVEKHNSIVERTFKLESDMRTAWVRYDEMGERIDRLTDKVDALTRIGGTD